MLNHYKTSFCKIIFSSRYTYGVKLMLLCRILCFVQGSLLDAQRLSAVLNKALKDFMEKR